MDKVSSLGILDVRIVNMDYNDEIISIISGACGFQDILEVDKRYDARAYAIVLSVIEMAFDNGADVETEDILDIFKETMLEQYGPMSYFLLSELGVTSCDDIGNIIINLQNSKHSDLPKNIDFNQLAFSFGYDFKEMFLDPYSL